ncbi:hypothetical protein HOY80DRAFT_159023 [Tuber brumale]|nr:hypothetical protein HOY80DRAFT_159023 [Tuber brumale]
MDYVWLFWQQPEGSAREEQGARVTRERIFILLQMIGIWLWRHRIFPESSPACPHTTFELHLWVMRANALSTRFPPFLFFIFLIFFFFATPSRVTSISFFALLTQSRRWAFLLRNTVVWSSLVVRQGWSIGLLCSHNHSGLETSRREHARVGCTLLREYDTYHA